MMANSLAYVPGDRIKGESNIEVLQQLGACHIYRWKHSVKASLWRYGA